MEQTKTKVESIAERLHGKPWEEVLPHIKKFMPFVGTYLLSDGSSVKRNGPLVHFHEIGIHHHVMRGKSSAPARR